MLPPEITDSIISHIEPGDVQTLNACASTFSGMVNASRTRVFDMPTPDLGTFQRAQSLFALISSPQNTINQHLACNVKGCNLGDKYPNRHKQYVDIGQLTSSIFTFQSLESLSISSYRWTFHIPVQIPYHYSSPHLPRLTLLDLSYVHFDSMQSLVQFICACPRLKILQLCLVTWPVNQSDIPATRDIPTWLNKIVFLTMESSMSQRLIPGQELVVTHYRPFVDWMLACHADIQSRPKIPANHLRTFPSIETIRGLMVHNEVADSLSALLSILEDGLKDVYLTIHPEHKYADDILWNHPTLQKVRQVYFTRSSGVAYFK